MAARKRPQSEPAAFVEPMQCKAVATLPESAGWLFEIKFDGYRCIAVKSGGNATLLSRNQKPLNRRFPAVMEAIADLPGDFTIDGELVALDEKGRPSFQLLQNSGSSLPPIVFYVFDLLHCDGRSLIAMPIEQRRERLARLLENAAGPLRLSPALEAEPAQIIDAIRTLGFEGVVGKRAGTLYEPGERSGAWIKHRTDLAQEFVIGGFVPGAHGFDSLIVGYYDKKRLTFAAKVRNGFVPRVRAEIAPSLKKLIVEECPFVNLPETGSSRWGEPLTAEKMKECRWIKPVLVCQVSFVEWTDGGKLRHCSFVGMRDDKKAAKVVRET